MTTPIPGIVTDRLLPLMQSLLDAFTTVLANNGLSTARASLLAGATAPWDVCCGDTAVGQSWVLCQRVTPILPTSAGVPLMSGCAWEYEATLQLGVLRCSAGPQSDGTPPPAGVLDDEATRAMFDMAMMRKAIVCYFPLITAPPLQMSDWRIGDYQALGPQGGCVGGAMTVFVRFSDCACP